MPVNVGKSIGEGCDGGSWPQMQAGGAILRFQCDHAHVDCHHDDARTAVIVRAGIEIARRLAARR